MLPESIDSFLHGAFLGIVTIVDFFKDGVFC